MGIDGMATGLVLIAVLFAFDKYRKYRASETSGFGKLLENKWYVDEFYDIIIVKPFRWFGKKIIVFTESEKSSTGL